MRLHFICSTLLSFGFFVNRNRKNTVSSLILKPFRKRYFPARGPFVLSYSVGGLDTEGPMKRLHVVGQRVCDFPAMYPSEPAALAGCGWPWPAPPRAEQLYCLFSVLDSCRRHHWEKGSAAQKMFGSHCLRVICYLLSLVQFCFPPLKANFCYKF